LKRRGLLDIAISNKRGYKNGMAQPGLLVMKRDGTALQKWAIIPGIVSPSTLEKHSVVCAVTDRNWGR
jgi:hypothetical protein